MSMLFSVNHSWQYLYTTGQDLFPDVPDQDHDRDIHTQLYVALMLMHFHCRIYRPILS
jgi:hypothetical protein